MQRVTVTLDDNLMTELDRLIERRGYQNRSEAIRDLARAGIAQAACDAETSSADCVATLVYVYDYETRDLSQRLMGSFHNHHDLALSTLHVHLDHESCLEVAVLRGKTVQVQDMADHVMAERGVRHGRLIMVPVKVEQQKHAHGEGPGRPHEHFRAR